MASTTPARLYVCEVALKLRCSDQQVYRYIRMGALKAARRGKHGRWMVDPADVEAMLSFGNKRLSPPPLSKRS